MGKKHEIHNVNIKMHIGDIDLSQDKISKYKFIIYLGDNIIIDKDTNKEIENTNGKFLFIPFDENDDGKNAFNHIDYIFEMKKKFDIRRPEKENSKSFDERVKDTESSYVYAFYDSLLDMGMSFIYNLHTPNQSMEEKKKSINFYRSKKYIISEEAKIRLQKLFEQENYNIFVLVQTSIFLSQIQALNEENRDDFVIEKFNNTYMCFSHKERGPFRW